MTLNSDIVSELIEDELASNEASDDAYKPYPNDLGENRFFPNLDVSGYEVIINELNGFKKKA